MYIVQYCVGLPVQHLIEFPSIFVGVHKLHGVRAVGLVRNGDDLDGLVQKVALKYRAGCGGCRQ